MQGFIIKVELYGRVCGKPARLIIGSLAHEQLGNPFIGDFHAQFAEELALNADGNLLGIHQHAVAVKDHMGKTHGVRVPDYGKWR